MMELLRLVLYLHVYTVFVFEVRVSSLRLVELRIPPHSVHNSWARLECKYELEPGESLYSVKWYKDGNEFFRFVPKDNPPTQVFDLPGVVVDLDNSTNVSIVLGPMTLTSSGRYRCEVSGEAPLFQTVSDHGDMEVVALPEKGPIITGSRPRYQIGDHVRVNCTSGQSKPAVKLNWFINGEPASSTLLKGPYIMETANEMEVTSLGLEFRIRPKHFRKGDLKLKCLATIATVYWKSNEESVQGEKQKSYTKTREVATSNSRADRVQASSISKGISSGTWIFHSPGRLWILTLLLIIHGR